MNWKQVLELFIYLIIGSGIGAFISQKLFEHSLNKRLLRFTKLYSDKLDVIKNLYRLLIKAEKSLDLLLSQREPINLNEKIEFKRNTLDVLNEFIDFFEENEIIFDKSIVDLMKQISDRFKKAKSIHALANDMESIRGSKEWLDATSKKQELHDQLVNIEIPELKEKLKTEFQNKYRILAE